MNFMKKYAKFVAFNYLQICFYIICSNGAIIKTHISQNAKFLKNLEALFHE